MLVSVFVVLSGPTYATPKPPIKPDDPALKIRTGPFTLGPSVGLRTRYDDNINRSQNNRRSDIITNIRPRLTLQGDWPAFRLLLDGRAEMGLFQRSSDDNYQDYKLATKARVSTGPASNLTADIAWQRGHDPRGSLDVPDSAAEPIIFDELSSSLTGAYATDNLHYESGLAFRRLTFDDARRFDGTSIRNDDRNRTETREFLRVLLPIGLGRETYGELSLNQRQYDRTPDDSGRVRDSAGFRALAGIRLDLTDLIKADIAGGWMGQSYADPAFGDISNYSLHADIDWAITGLTNLNFTASRQIRETTLVGASGILALQGSIGLRHELRRFWYLDASLNWTDETFRQTERRDQTAALQLGSQYRLNPIVRINATARFDRRQSNSSDNSYHRMQTLLGLVLEM